jgi:ribonuclease HI
MLLRYGKSEKTLSGFEAETTNNRMELTAAIRALQALTRPCKVDFYTDSEYLKKRHHGMDAGLASAQLAAQGRQIGQPRLVEGPG